VRLNEVAPDGSSLRVSYGLLNLTHRDSHEEPTPIVPGQRYTVRIKLNDAAHAFRRGHRIRLAVSSSYWPIAWPSPEHADLKLFTGASRLVLPVRHPRPEDTTLPPFPPAEEPQPLKTSTLRQGRIKETIERDLISGETIFTTDEDLGLVRIDEMGISVDHQ
jgi:predicted acyl esterase